MGGFDGGFSGTRVVCRAIATAAVLALAVVAGRQADAAEYGKGIYLLGIKTSMAGFVPPPGTYLTAYQYYYTGSASGTAANSVLLNDIGNVSIPRSKATLTVQAELDVDANIFIDLPTVLWVTPHKVLGGNLGVGVLAPVGWQDVSADINALATLNFPVLGITLQRSGRLSLNDETFNFGDPLALALIGWHQGNWHWNVQGLLNVPIGAYNRDDLANMGFHRWAFDATGAATWLDLTTGREASAAAGFTFNGENPDTDYTTGTEFHAEFALMQHLSKAFSIGIAGYHYQQVSGDSGSGARLGSFKGRVTALGPNIDYSFKLGALPVSTSLRWFHEFDVKNRLEGDSAFLNFTIPLGGGRQ